MRRISKIVLHCSATRPTWGANKTAEEKRDEIKRWHVNGLGLSDISYHYLIDRDGRVVDGRPLQHPSAHTCGQNRDSIDVCLIGGHGSTSKSDFADNFAETQEKALTELLFGISGSIDTMVSVHGHNEFAAKACPGFKVREWWQKVLDDLAGTPKPVCANYGAFITAPDPMPDEVANTPDQPTRGYQARP